MTICCSDSPTVPAASQIRQPAPSFKGVAPAATDWKLPIISEMVSEMHACGSPGWDGYGAEALTPVAYGLARSFLDALPHALPKPRLVTEPDGCFAFEWHRGNWRSLVVSVSPDYRLHYSALLDKATRRTASGEEKFFGEIPVSVRKLLLEIHTPVA